MTRDSGVALLALLAAGIGCIPQITQPRPALRCGIEVITDSSGESGTGLAGAIGFNDTGITGTVAFTQVQLGDEYLNHLVLSGDLYPQKGTGVLVGYGLAIDWVPTDRWGVGLSGNVGYALYLGDSSNLMMRGSAYISMGSEVRLVGSALLGLTVAF